jgi:hypothetical protein
MIGKTIRKSCIALIILAAVFISTDCNKQVRCGCGKDIYLSFPGVPVYIYFSADKAVITASLVGQQYVVYNFCNPTEMAAKLVDAQYGDIMLLTGDVYYDCQSVYQQSNSGYQGLVQYYQVQVSELVLDMYGKKSGNPVN